jgi:hypothetical protein
LHLDVDDVGERYVTRRRLLLATVHGEPLELQGNGRPVKADEPLVVLDSLLHGSPHMLLAAACHTP